MFGLSAKVQSILSPISVGKTLILTVGNPLRTDDGVGPYIASGLRSFGRLIVIDAQSNPENHLEAIASLAPAKVVFIDAADFKGVPGDVQEVTPDNISSCMQSTHGIPLSLIIQLLKEDVPGPIHMLGIQIKDVSFHEGLSNEVRKTADSLIDYIHNMYK